MLYINLVKFATPVFILLFFNLYNQIQWMKS